jgi:hypothetical protein
MTLSLAGAEFAAETVSTPGEPAHERVLATLPLTVRLVHEEWSGALVSSLDKIDPTPYAGDHTVAFPQPATIYIAQDDGSVVICYGQGRFRDGLGPRPLTPVGQVRGNVPEFLEACRQLQFRGVTELGITSRAEAVVNPEPAPSGPEIQLQVGDAVARAVLLAERCPGLVESFLAQLPGNGFATNTHSSGPLVRFWNEKGGDEGETPLDIGSMDGPPQAVLYFGHIYYMPKPGFRGLRIPGREATMMASAARGGGSELYPLARFVDGLDEFSGVVRGLRLSGSLPMTVVTV